MPRNQLSPPFKNQNLLEDQRSYTYIYLDPRKPGNYQYGEYYFDHEPFYVGKGTCDRFYDHIKEVRKFIDARMTNKEIKNLKGNFHKQFKIKKIINLNLELEPIIIKIKENLSDKEAKIFEIKLISIIGRFDKKLGPLTNMTDGGDGAKGWIPSEEYRRNMSLLMTGKKKRNTENMKHLLSDEHKKKISESKILLYSSEEGKKVIELIKMKLKGKVPWNKGMIFSEEDKIKYYSDRNYDTEKRKKASEKIIKDESYHQKLRDGQKNRRMNEAPGERERIGRKISEVKRKNTELLNPIIFFECECCKELIIDMRIKEIEIRFEKYGKFICKHKGKNSSASCAYKLSRYG